MSLYVDIPAISGGFGADTTISALNGSGTSKTILELVAAYTSNTAGSEASSWTIKVYQGGAQTTAQTITGVGTMFPDGVYDGTPANTRSSVAVGVVGTGMSRNTNVSAVAFHYAGTALGYWSASRLECTGTFAALAVSGTGGANDGTVERTVDASSSQSNISVIGRFSGALTDVVIGSNAQLTRSAAGGFLQLPVIDVSGGEPTGSPKLNTGKFALAVGTDFALRLWNGTAWRKSAAMA